MEELDAEGPKGEAPYMVEPAKSNRSTCKACKEKIDKGEVRFGSLVEMAGGGGSYHWRHAKCITAKQAANVESKVGGVIKLAGYEALTPGQKTQLAKAFAAAKKDGDTKDKAKAKAKAKAEAVAKAKATKKAKAKAKAESAKAKKAAAKAKKAAAKAKKAEAKAKAKAKAEAKKAKAKAKAKAPGKVADPADAEDEARAPAGEVEMPSEREQHAFLNAAKRFDFDRVRDLVEENPAYVNVQPAGRWSALHQAAEQGDIEMVSYLVEKGASLSAKTKDGKTPHDVAKDNCKALLVPTAKRRGGGPEPPAKRRAA